MFVSRAGAKLDHALTAFAVNVAALTCCDLGSNTGGFVDCLLQRGAGKVYAIDAGHGALEWKLRKDPRVIVMERTNAMHVTLAEQVDLVTIDVAWTRQRNILPAVARMIKPAGQVIALLKLHYEADKSFLRKGILPPEKTAEVLALVAADITACGFELLAITASPIAGRGGNRELLGWLRPVGALAEK